EWVRLRAQFAREPALPLSGRILRTVRHEQQGGVRAHPGRRLRRHAQDRQRRTQKHLPRIRRWPNERPYRLLSPSALIASRISSNVTSLDRNAEPIFGVTTNRTAPLSNFLSCVTASKICSRENSFGNFVGNSKRRKRSTIASRSFFGRPARFIEMSAAAIIPRLIASPCPSIL